QLEWPAPAQFVTTAGEWKSNSCAAGSRNCISTQWPGVVGKFGTWQSAIGNWKLAIGNRKYCYGNTLQRLEFRCSHVMEESRLDVGGGHIACARHWSEHDDRYLVQIR